MGLRNITVIIFLFVKCNNTLIYTFVKCNNTLIYTFVFNDEDQSQTDQTSAGCFHHWAESRDTY